MVFSFCSSTSPFISFHKPTFHMIATIAVIAAIADKNGSAIAAIDAFLMLAAIAE